MNCSFFQRKMFSWENFLEQKQLRPVFQSPILGGTTQYFLLPPYSHCKSENFLLFIDNWELDTKVIISQQLILSIFSSSFLQN